MVVAPELINSSVAAAQRRSLAEETNAINKQANRNEVSDFAAMSAFVICSDPPKAIRVPTGEGGKQPFK